MIITYAYDVEILKNFFSISIVNVTSYLKVFSDACNVNKKGKKEAVPLIQKFAVDEIKTRLDSVETHDFYITDTDDSQLFPMLSFINDMRPHVVNSVAIRTDMFGYNSNSYDKLMVAGLLMYANQTNTTKELITKLYELSKYIISLQNDKDRSNNDYFLHTLRQYKLPFINIDIMTIFALNKVGKGTDSNGKTVYFGKSLKQTSINLQWYDLLEYELPPISEKDVHYYKNTALYKEGIDYLNKYTNKWDRYIIDEWIPDTMKYNRNDTFIVAEMIRLFIDEIKLRYNISKAYGVDVLSSSRSNIADKLFIKFYSDFSGLSPSQWRGNKTERTAMAFKKVIFPFIKFKTKPLQELLEEMKQVIVYSVSKKALKEISTKYPNFKYLKTNNDSGWFEITINNLTYTIATGGLHSKDIPRELRSKLIYAVDPSTGKLYNESKNIWDRITDDSYIYVHYDIASFYPSIMDIYKISPKHLDKTVFVRLIHWLKETRVTAKHSKEELIDGIPKNILAQVLKIVINSIYGKLGIFNAQVKPL